MGMWRGEEQQQADVGVGPGKEAWRSLRCCGTKPPGAGGQGWRIRKALGTGWGEVEKGERGDGKDTGLTEHLQQSLL